MFLSLNRPFSLYAGLPVHETGRIYATTRTVDICAWPGLIPGLRPASERRRYFVTTSLIGWSQAWNQPWWRCKPVNLTLSAWCLFPYMYRWYYMSPIPNHKWYWCHHCICLRSGANRHNVDLHRELHSCIFYKFWSNLNKPMTYLEMNSIVSHDLTKL